LVAAFLVAAFLVAAFLVATFLVGVREGFPEVLPARVFPAGGLLVPLLFLEFWDGETFRIFVALDFFDDAGLPACRDRGPAMPAAINEGGKFRQEV